MKRVLPSREEVLAEFWAGLGKVKLKPITNIPVFGQNVSVNHRKPISTEHGNFCVDERTINLNNNLKGAFAVRVLMHELEHAKLRLNGFDYHITEDEEEQLCTIAESYFEDVVYVIKLLEHLADG